VVLDIASNGLMPVAQLLFLRVSGFEAGVLATVCLYSLPRARGLPGAGVESPSPAPSRRGSRLRWA
jgi:hypothetical protein